jgi:hypothetical protein
MLRNQFASGMFVGSRELPIELDKEHARLRAMLSELGMAK